MSSVLKNKIKSHSGYFPVFLLLFTAGLLESIVCGHSFNHLPSFRQLAQIDSIPTTPLKQPSSRSPLTSMLPNPSFSFGAFWNFLAAFAPADCRVNTLLETPLCLLHHHTSLTLFHLHRLLLLSLLSDSWLLIPAYSLFFSVSGLGSRTQTIPHLPVSIPYMILSGPLTGSTSHMLMLIQLYLLLKPQTHMESDFQFFFYLSHTTVIS